MSRKTKNKYIYPVEINDKVRITYDESPAHVGNLKNSVDFITEEGLPVKASFDGTVVDLKSDSDIGGEDKDMEQFGNFVEIEHASGEYSEYEHLKQNSVMVKLGDAVKKGQIIGYTGSTGWIAHLGPHLHFMVGEYGETDAEYETLQIVWDKN